jgi:hypothetical protein
MTPDAPKWGLFDLLKVLDTLYDGQYHTEFVRIAQGLGLELPAVAPPPDQDPDSEDEGDGEQESQQDRILEFLGSQTEPVTLGRIVAELNANRWTVNSTLHRLLKKGNVEHVGRDAWKIAAPVEP